VPADTDPITAGATRVAMLPFDHTRRATSVLVDEAGTRKLVVKGAPEQVLAGCADVAEVARRTLDALFADGRRVVAVAVKEAPGLTTVIAADDETGLALTGFLTFADNPKAAARQSLARLGALEIEVKVAAGTTRACPKKSVPNWDWCRRVPSPEARWTGSPSGNSTTWWRPPRFSPGRPRAEGTTDHLRPQAGAFGRLPR
jgi:hypothetical protein